MKLATGALILTAGLVLADTLYLRDGRVIHGTFISGNSSELRFLPDGGGTQRYALSTVDRLTFSAADQTSSSTATASNRTTAARRSDRSASTSRARSAANEIPAGTVVTVRMIDAIDSNETDVGRRYRASLDEPVIVDGRTIAPRGAEASVEVVRAEQSGTFSGREEIALRLTEIYANGRRLTPVTQDAEVSAKSRSRETATVVGGTAAVGAIIGAIAGGGKGAAIGAASGAGAGAAIQAIRGQQIKVPSETTLDFTLAQPLRY